MLLTGDWRLTDRGKRSLAWKSPAVQHIHPIYSSLAGIDLITS
ncbi:hypothetical protein [Priestia megaterium]